MEQDLILSASEIVSSALESPPSADLFDILNHVVDLLGDILI